MRLRSIVIVALAFLALMVLVIWMFAPWVLSNAQQPMDHETLAVVARPLPSAPIALAAGAAYGHLWGTRQVIVGAEIGALVAFGLARVRGRDAVKRLFGDTVDHGLPGSQKCPDDDRLCQPLIAGIAIVGMIAVFVFERAFLDGNPLQEAVHGNHRSG